jgi:hypothetical protein
MKATLSWFAAFAMVSAHADETFHCGKWVISSDMPLSELSYKCGEPVSRTRRTEDVRAPGPSGAQVKVGVSVIETWTYDRGTQAAPMVVTIIDGAIKSIERRR